ncbi:MAG: sulfatase-like hydrolase/transferase [Limisphaerales bacterium]
MSHLRSLLASLVLSTTMIAADRPNIVVIMADDIGFECYSCYGSEYYKTPNIDKLAASGAKFTQAYSQPICTPSRVKIMTGRYNFKNYTVFGELDLTQDTFAKVAKSAGYSTYIAGKWQLSPGNLNGPHEAGFDEYCLWHFAKGGPGGPPLATTFKNKGSRFKSPHLFENGELIPDTENKYGPEIVTTKICEFIERKKDENFVVYYPMINVHSPFVPTPDSPDWEETDKSRGSLEHFRDMVQYMDKSIGRIVKKLDDTGLRENTLVIVTGDNGTHQKLTSPFPGRGEIKGGKGMMTDAGNRVAFVANWPATIKPGTVIDKPVDFASILPTVADLTGAKTPKTADGQSLVPLLSGNTSQARDWIFMSYNRGGGQNAKYRAFVRDEKWKLYSDGSLYNVPNDWLEQKPITHAKGDKARQRLQPILDRILSEAPDGRIATDPPTAKKKRKKNK